MPEDILMQAFLRLAILIADRDCQWDAARYKFDYENKSYYVTVEMKEDE